jgi:hypothetical protein
MRLRAVTVLAACIWIGASAVYLLSQTSFHWWIAVVCAVPLFLLLWWQSGGTGDGPPFFGPP